MKFFDLCIIYKFIVYYQIIWVLANNFFKNIFALIMAKEYTFYFSNLINLISDKEYGLS